MEGGNILQQQDNARVTMPSLCLPCVNSFEIMGLCTLRSIKSSKTMMLLCLGSISLKSSRNLGRPSLK